MLTLKECLTMAGMSEEEAEKIVHGTGMTFILSGGLAPFLREGADGREDTPAERTARPIRRSRADQR